MAKKGQQVQIQAEIQSDDEWDKLLQREGLIVADVYSEWAGPCAAMLPSLKKIKMEVGGDFLHLAIARADAVTVLNRFADKCQPTWMFLAQGRRVNLVYGLNAPFLTQLIITEIQKEKDCMAGYAERVDNKPEDLTEEEQEEFDLQMQKNKDIERLLEEKAMKQYTDRHVAQAKNILDTMGHFGLILATPQASRKFNEVMEPLWKPSGFTISKKDRPRITTEMLDEIMFCSPYKFPEETVNNIISDRSYAVLVTQEDTKQTSIDDAVLRFVYGDSKLPPGDTDSPGQLLLKRILKVRSGVTIEDLNLEEVIIMPPTPMPEEEIGGGEEVEEEEKMEDEESEDNVDVVVEKMEIEEAEKEVQEEIIEEKPDDEEYDEIWGLWSPPNDIVKATAMKHFFPLITAPLILPEPEPTPPHIAMAFDAIKRFEVLKLRDDEYPNDVMAYGFFTSDNYETAKLIAKTKQRYEKTFDKTKFGEKIVIQVSRKKSDAVLAFAQLGPCYMSMNINEGEKECAAFFPEGYNASEDIGDDRSFLERTSRGGSAVTPATSVSKQMSEDFIAVVVGEEEVEEEEEAEEEGDIFLYEEGFKTEDEDFGMDTLPAVEDPN